MIPTHRFSENKKMRKLHTASLDRIDSSKGYTMNNIQWIHKRINIMKMNMSDNELLSFCTAIVDYSKIKNKL